MDDFKTQDGYYNHAQAIQKGDLHRYGAQSAGGFTKSPCFFPGGEGGMGGYYAARA